MMVCVQSVPGMVEFPGTGDGTGDALAGSGVGAGDGEAGAGLGIGDATGRTEAAGTAVASGPTGEEKIGAAVGMGDAETKAEASGTAETRLEAAGAAVACGAYSGAAESIPAGFGDADARRTARREEAAAMGSSVAEAAAGALVGLVTVRIEASGVGGKIEASGTAEAWAVALSAGAEGIAKTADVVAALPRSGPSVVAAEPPRSAEAEAEADAAAVGAAMSGRTSLKRAGRAGKVRLKIGRAGGGGKRPNGSKGLNRRAGRARAVAAKAEMRRYCILIGLGDLER